ncbi:MAG: RNase III inhibitor, partial [Synergistaceae bacterium]|nr:RNase III inhibitor [Synergistaceae bacterium]
PDHPDESFAEALLRIIGEKGRTDEEVRRRANIDRRVFGKIRGGRSCAPDKKTALALAVSLELTLAETAGLLERADSALSRGALSDVIAEYFITRGRYDIHEINIVLFKHDQPLLGV